MADIVLRDHTGSPIEYPGVDIIRVAGVDGEAKYFGAYDPAVLTPDKLLEGVSVGDVTGSVIIPETLENVPVTLDFSGGDQTITAPDGSLVKSAIIQKPETLVQENIAEGVDIAGIIGTFAAGGSKVKITTGSFTGGSAITVNHNLGVVPDIFIVLCGKNERKNSLIMSVGFSSAFRAIVPDTPGFSAKAWLYSVYQDGSGYAWDNRRTDDSGIDLQAEGTTYLSAATENTIYVGTQSTPTVFGVSSWLAIGGLT